MTRRKSALTSLNSKMKQLRFGRWSATRQEDVFLTSSIFVSQARTKSHVSSSQDKREARKRAVLEQNRTLSSSTVVREEVFRGRGGR